MSSGVVLLLLRWIVDEEGGIERKAEVEESGLGMSKFLQISFD